MRHVMMNLRVHLGLIAKAVACIDCTHMALWVSQNSCGQYHRVVVLGWSVTLFTFLRSPSWPNKPFAGFCQTLLLDSSDCSLGMHGYCSGVPRDCVDTLNSTLLSGVSFLACGDFVHCLFNFLLIWDRRISASTFHLALLGQKSVWDCLPSIFFLGCSEWWVPMKKALKSQLLGDFCASDMNHVGLMLGHRNALPNSMMARGD